MDIIQSIRGRVRQTMSTYKMLNPGDKVVIGVSGGPDSVCLLDILHQFLRDLDIKLVVAHFDHGLRPQEDDKETAFVQEIASSLNVPFKTGKASGMTNKTGLSLEELARDARYDFLKKTKKQYTADKIALGHNMNDQAETVIMRLLRGSGPSGLSGIPPCREPGIIRPLIEIERKDILAYLEERRLGYVSDSSNIDTKFLRNKIRIELIPQLQTYQPRLAKILSNTAKIIRDEDYYMEAAANEWLSKNSESDLKNNVTIPLDSFPRLPEPVMNRVIRVALKDTDKRLRRIDLSHINSIKSLALGDRPQGMLNLPNGLIVKRSYDALVFSWHKNNNTGFQFSIDGPGTYDLDTINCRLIIEEIKDAVDYNEQRDEFSAFIDADAIQYPLTVRNFQHGDRFIPLGMKGHKKIKDYFIDKKILSEKRTSTPIVLSGKKIIWVCGFRIDDSVKITPGTSNTIKLTLMTN